MKKNETIEGKHNVGTGLQADSGCMCFGVDFSFNKYKVMSYDIDLGRRFKLPLVDTRVYKKLLQYCVTLKKGLC